MVYCYEQLDPPCESRDSVQVKDLMYHYQEELENCIRRVVSPQYFMNFCDILCNGYENNDEKAEQMLLGLALDKKHVYAYLNDVDNFEWCLIRESE